MKVFYRPEQTAANAGSYSPSAAKPAQVVRDWLDKGVIREEDILDYEPVSREDLALAHDPRYVDGVLDLDLANGFNNRDPQVAASLPYTTGSLLAAAEHAVLHRTVTCSPTSGFHHAGYDFAGGFCTFNGLMVAALALQRHGLVRRVEILDCDAHYGNGTADIIERLGLRWVVHRTFGEWFHQRRDLGVGARAFETWLLEAIDAMARCDLVIYQAGADPHVLDPLGGFLTDEQMAWRDETVFAHFAGRALAWNLAGGYQRDGQGGIEPVLRLHRLTMRAAVQAMREAHRA